MNILREVSLGQHYFIMAKLLRETMFLSVALLNADTWLNLTQGDIKELDLVDRLLLKQIFGVSSSCPSSGLYMELGCTPVSLIIKAKRLMFLHYIVSREKEELISKIFWAQVKQPVKNDWAVIVIVKQDLEDFGINYTFEEITSIGKERFKLIVKEKMNTKAFNILNGMKEEKSKLAKLTYDKLGLQKYLSDSEMSIKHKKRETCFPV